MNKIPNNSVGFEDDEIFLLSIEEYEKYKNVIPYATTCWWLRSPGDAQYGAANVNCVGSISYRGSNILYDTVCVRPVIRTLKNTYNVGDIICSAGYTWVIIDRENGIAIAEMPIAQRRFDPSSNDYKTSEIRQWLIDWYEWRCERFGKY